MVVKESHKKGHILKKINKTNISMILKVKYPLTFADFRPISLCNSIYRIITKAIYLKHKYLIPRLVSLSKEVLSLVGIHLMGF